MSEKTFDSIPDSWTVPFVAGKFALDAAMLATLSLARFAQIGARSADAAIEKYIELTEQELKRSQKRESVKVD